MPYDFTPETGQRLVGVSYRLEVVDEDDNKWKLGVSESQYARVTVGEKYTVRLFLAMNSAKATDDADALAAVGESNGRVPAAARS
jgi:hypothetical protein